MNIVRSRIWLVMLMVVIFGAGYIAGGAGSCRDNQVKANASSEEQAQLEVAQAYLTAFQEEDWPRFASCATEKLWPAKKLAESKAVQILKLTFGLVLFKPNLPPIEKLELGPEIDWDFFDSSLPMEGLDPSAWEDFDKGTWPDRCKKPRAVTYYSGGKQYVLYLVWENGGWHAFGGPRVTPAKILNYESYNDVTEEIFTTPQPVE